MSTGYMQAEARRKAELSRREATQLVERALHCPECGYKAGSAFSDCTGHLTIRCRKCKAVSVLNLAYFRRQRQRPGRMFGAYHFR